MEYSTQVAQGREKGIWNTQPKLPKGERKGFGILNQVAQGRERDLEYSTKLPKGERKGLGILNQVALREKQTLKVQSKLLGNNFIIKKGNFPPKGRPLSGKSNQVV